VGRDRQPAGLDFFGKTSGLSGTELTSAEFQKFFEQVESGVVGPLVNSTGNLMDDMILKGFSTYDCVFVYENVAIDSLRKAEGKWKNGLRVVYPKRNMWNDNPYYVLDVPWSTPAHRKAADAFLRYLTSEPVQARAMAHGFRPANTNVPTAVDDSPFVKFKDYGLSLNVEGAICEPPRAEVINGLLNRWQQVRGAR
jgi:ABC-type glycerol-3-phosphate transport system substrate-binding protein